MKKQHHVGEHGKPFSQLTHDELISEMRILMDLEQERKLRDKFTRHTTHHTKVGGRVAHHVFTRKA